jgi:hypothetical protein
VALLLSEAACLAPRKRGTEELRLFGKVSYVFLLGWHNSPIGLSTDSGAEGAGMLLNLSEEERLWHERAHECAEAAKEALTEDIRAQYQRLEESWLTLASTYQFAKRLAAFTDLNKKRTAEFELRLVDGQKLTTPDNSDREWQSVSCAPYDCDLELAVLAADGAHALVFPCRRILGGWIKAKTNQRLEVYPTHWRKWQDCS